MKEARNVGLSVDLYYKVPWLTVVISRIIDEGGALEKRLQAAEEKANIIAREIDVVEVRVYMVAKTPLRSASVTTPS